MSDYEKLPLEDDHLLRNASAYAPGVLKPMEHFQLVEDLHRFCLEAGVAEDYVTHSMLDYCNGFAEIDWMRNYPSHIEEGCYGAVFVDSPKILTRMSAMVGCCLRNYIQARLTTVQTLISELKDGNLPIEDLLAITNFCLPKTKGGGIPTWQLPLLIGMLYERFAHKRYTVLYVSSMNDVKAQYGTVISQHIEDYFEIMSEC